MRLAASSEDIPANRPLGSGDGVGVRGSMMSSLAWPLNHLQVGLATPFGASSSTRVGPSSPVAKRE